MYRLLIADDEESIREGTAAFIRRSCPEWEITALAEDGREALALARKTLPDVILTDITMPHMNGLDFLESLRDILPEARMLILSGYDQFEYALQAIRLGVRDYLLKPLDTAKLVAALDRFAQELQEQERHWAQVEAVRTSTRKTNMLEIQGYFRSVLLGEPPAPLSGENAVYVREKNSYCCVLCAGMDRHRDLLETMLEQRLYGSVKTVLFRVGTPPQLGIVFCAPEEMRQRLFLTLNRTLTSIAVTCRRMEALDVHFFVGCICDEVPKLEVSYRQCREARTYAFLEQAAPVTTYEDVLASKLLPCPELPEELMTKIPEAVKCGNRRAFAEYCEQLFRWFDQKGILDSMFIRMCILQICYSVGRRPTEENPISFYEFTSFQTEIILASNMADLRACLENFVSVQWLRVQEANTAAPSLADRVREIVRGHISDIEFTFEDVASVLFISPNYLRQLFKQETGQTFTEFLTEQRMQHARLLLGNPDNKICDVAAQAGYADSRYFSVCFKKYYHMTPSEYQASFLRE